MIHIKGCCHIDASSQEVWNHFFNADSLQLIIPGCRSLKQISDDTYTGVIEIGTAAIKGTYNTQMVVIRDEANLHCDFVGEVDGPTGFISGKGFFQFKEVHNQTNIEYQVNALVTGALARINPMFIEGIAKTLIKHGMSRFNQHLGKDSWGCDPD